MITTLFINFLYFIITTVFGWLPTVTVMPEWYTPVHDVFGVFGVYNNIPILGTAITIVGLVLLILSGWQGVVFVNWLYNKIRGSG